MKKILTFMSLVAGLFLAGCAGGSNGLSEQPDVINAPFETVWKELPVAMVEAGLSVTNQDKSSGNINGSAGVTAFSWGQTVLVHAESLSANTTGLTIIQKNGSAALNADWNEKITKTLNSRINPK